MKRSTPFAGPNVQASEVAWYKIHGRHRDRIARLKVAPYSEYVIGDWSWNRNNPGREEMVEHLMPRE